MNWSLKLHIRLRTISLLISTHITHVNVQWMSYSFVWLYLIKCVFTAQSLLIKYKKIFSVLNVFGKYFVFAKIVKIFKNCVALFWWLSHGLVQLHALVASPHRDFPWLTGMSMSQLWKIFRIFFKFWVFNVSRGLDWWLVRGWGF